VTALQFVSILAVCIVLKYRKQLWSHLLGKRMTRRLMKLVLPDLVWNQEIYGKLLQGHISKDTKWLDVGCGWRLLGRHLEPIEDALVANAGMTVGCDLSFDGLIKHRNISKLVLASANDLPFRESTFNLVTCNMVVEHLEDPAKTFRELARVLSPGGELIIHTPNLLNYAVFLNHTVMRLLPRKFVLRFIQLGESRKEEDIFPTFYRANTVRHLAQVGAKFHLNPDSHRMLTPPQPFFTFFWPLAFLQMLIMRLTMTRYFRKFAGTILMVLKHQPASHFTMTAPRCGCPSVEPVPADGATESVSEVHTS
jgi:ubiquinone/menaquinone biosynthesis C-methylase UbiE